MVVKAKQSRLVPAVGYLRRSDEGQQASIADQTKAVQKYADEHGYCIIRWYTDDAISGDDTESREAFQQMIADAQERRDFEVILCWDQDRFGRFDSLEAGFWIHPLRRLGVGLVTVTEGPIDWNDYTGRLMYTLKQEGKHQFLQDLSRNVARGQMEAMNNGSWVGSPPYGYRVVGPKKQKRLVLGEPAHYRVVQRIFREFVEEGRPANNIAARLQSEGFPSPGGRGKPWRYDTVKVILANPAYCGDYAGGRYSYGKYHTIREGKVTKAKGRSSKPESEWIVRRDHHEAIIDRPTWEQAQRLLAKQRDEYNDARGTGHGPYTPETNPFVLTGVLRCGKCGCPLNGVTTGRNAHRYYECRNRRYNGSAACEGTTVREERILVDIADHLESWLGPAGKALGTAAYYGALEDANLKEWFPEGTFAKVKRLVTPPAKPKQDRQRLERRLEQLTAQVEKARGNLVLLDPANIPAAQKRISELDEEVAAVEQELRECKPPSEKDINAVVLSVLHNLYSLAYCCRVMAKPASYDEKGNREVDNGDGTVTCGSLESAAPRAVKWLRGRMTHIIIHTRKTGRGGGTRHLFEKGEIVLQVSPGQNEKLEPSRTKV